MTPLDNAPPALIRWYERRSKDESPFKDLLKELYEERHKIDTSFITGQKRRLLKNLLYDTRMKRPWNTLSKYLKTEDDFQNFFKEIIEALRVARCSTVNPTETRAWYENIATRTDELARSIELREPLPGTVLLYQNDLDVEVNELIPEDELEQFGVQLSELNSYSLRRSPRIVLLLGQLANRARRQGSAHVSSGKRSRLSPEEAKGLTEDKKDKERAAKTKARLFACHLDSYLRKVDKTFRGHAAIHVIASIACDVHSVDQKTVNKWIMDHRQKKTT